jgi:large subunit ribosomal protein L1
MSKSGKRYAEAMKAFERDRFYSPADAVHLIKSLPSTKFDETVELSLRLGIDARKADQMVRGAVSLPKGTGKDVRVIAFAKGEKAREAVEAGADVVGDDDLAQRIQSGWLEFDAAVASPDMMPVVGRLGRILGPRGLMPNPKSGTVTEDVAKAVRDLKGGLVEYRTDRHGNVHLIVGKRSFPEDDLLDNYIAVADEIIRAKPAAAKGRYLKSITLSTTMGPGIRIDPQKVKERDETQLAAAAR